MIRAQALLEARLLLRNGEQLLLAVAIPLLVLVGGERAGTLIDLGELRRIDVLTPGVIALAVLSTAFTSVAISTGFERRYGVLKRLAATPLPRSGLLLGKVGAVQLVLAGQLTLISATAALLGWAPSADVWAVLSALALVVTGTAAFGALALALAGVLRAEATLAAANLVYLLLLVGGGVLVPLDRYPAAASAHLALLPSGALAEGLREALTGAGTGGSHLPVLAGWTLLGAAVVARTFRWD